MMNGHAPAGGNPCERHHQAATHRVGHADEREAHQAAEIACANEFQVACSNAEKSTAKTIDRLTQLAP